MDAFRFEAVTVERDHGRVLDGVTARVPAGCVTVVVGPSGAGKTTLLRLCNRLEVPTRGRVWFGDRDVAGLDPLWLRRRVGMVFQQPVLIAGTVRDNLRLADPDADDAALAEALERVLLDPRLLDRPATELSGGEAQRVCLARTLLAAPEVLLLDEPTNQLHGEARTAFERLVRDLVSGGLTAVWVTHDEAQQRRMADHTIVLEAGRVVAEYGR